MLRGEVQTILEDVNDVEPVDPGIVKMLEYKPQRLRPVVMIPGQKPHVAGSDFADLHDAHRWASGFISAPGTFIKEGTTVRIGSLVYAVITMSNGAHRLQYLGPKRTIGPMTETA